MKVRYQAVGSLELISRIYKYIRLSAVRMYNSILIRCRFKCTKTCCTYTYYPATGRTRCVNLISLLFRDNKHLRVHVMLLYIFYFYRSECSKAYMKSYIGNNDSLFLKLLKKLLCKMKSCCRCSRRAFILRIDSLISVPIL